MWKMYLDLENVFHFKKCYYSNKATSEQQDLLRKGIIKKVKHKDRIDDDDDNNNNNNNGGDDEDEGGKNNFNKNKEKLKLKNRDKPKTEYKYNQNRMVGDMSGVNVVKVKVKNLIKINDRSHHGGYADNITSLRFSAPVEDFFLSREPGVFLGSFHELYFVNVEKNKININPDNNLSDYSSISYYNHPSTTEEIQEYLSDLRVLGKKEFRTLLKWRGEMIRFFFF
jgi:hypothetical protein